MIDDDDDHTVIQTDADKEKLEKDILGVKYDADSEDDTTIPAS